MKLLVVLLLLGAAISEAKSNRRWAGDMSDSSSHMDFGKGANKKAWAIGHCITRFVCGLPCHNGDTGSGGGMVELDCFPGGKKMKEDAAACASKCSPSPSGVPANPDTPANPDAPPPAPHEGRRRSMDAADEQVNCSPPDCSIPENSNHYYCNVNCITPADADRDETCAQVTCNPEMDGYDQSDPPKMDHRCSKSNTNTRRRAFIKRRLMRRLGAFARARNFGGMRHVMRRMEKYGVAECRRPTLVKFLLYPVAIVKCIAHRLFCLVKPSACAAGNYVQIKNDGSSSVDSSMSMSMSGAVLDCTITPATRPECQKQCWVGGTDEGGDGCPADCKVATTDTRCIDPNA